MKKVALIILFLVVAPIVSIFLFNRFFPGKEIPFLTGENSPVKGVVCSYPVRVSGSSMEPILKENSLVVFDKCISKIKEGLATGTVIIFSQDGQMRMRTIREKLESESGVYYKVSPEARPQDLMDIFPNSIIGVYNASQ